MKTAIYPLDDRVVIRRSAELKDKTDGGIYIPNAAQEKPVEGAVVEIGDSVVRLHPADRVIFGKYAGTHIDHNGEELLIMRESEILARIETTE